MQATLDEAVGILDRWSSERKAVTCSFSANGFGVVCFGNITRPEPQIFVVRYHAGELRPLTLTIFPYRAERFDYHDDREVPEPIAHIASDVLEGLEITFSDASYLLLYAMKD